MGASISYESVQIGGDINTADASADAAKSTNTANVLLSVDTTVAVNSCRKVRNAIKGKIEKGEANKNMVTQMKNFDKDIGAEGFTEIKKRPNADCIIVCSYDRESGIVLPVQRDDPNKQLIIRFCKKKENKCTITFYLKDDRKYKKYYNKKIFLQPGEIINFTNSVYNKDASFSIIFDKNNDTNATIKIKTNGGYYNDLYSAEYIDNCHDSISKNIDPLSYKSDNCYECHISYNSKNKKTELPEFMFKYCPDSGTVCIKQCLVCGKGGIDSLVETPVDKDDHIDKSEDPENCRISEIFSEKDYFKVRDGNNRSWKRVNQYKFNCKPGFDTDTTIENMNKSDIKFSKYFKLINIQKGDDNAFSAFYTFAKINNKIKYDNVIGLETDSNGEMFLSYKDFENSDNKNSSGFKSVKENLKKIKKNKKYKNIEKIPNNNFIIFDYKSSNAGNGTITINDRKINKNKPFIFLVKNGDNYNLLIPKTQKIYNKFCIDTWSKNMLSDHGDQDAEQIVKNKEDAAKAAELIKAVIIRKLKIKETSNNNSSGGFLSHHNRIEFAKYNNSVTKEVLKRAKIRLSQAKRLNKSTNNLKRVVTLSQQAHTHTQKKLKKIIR